MSSKNCRHMELIWDLGPMIWTIKTRRRPCRRRCPPEIRSVRPLWARSLPFVAQKPSCEASTVSKLLKRSSTHHFNLASSKKICLEFREFMAMFYFWWQRLPLLEPSWPLAGDGDGNVDALLHELTWVQLVKSYVICTFCIQVGDMLISFHLET